MIEHLEIQEKQIVQKGKELTFLGIYFKDERIGYVKNRLIQSAENEFKLVQNAFLILNILNESHPVNMELEANLTDTFILKNFTFLLSSPFNKMNAKGTVTENEVAFTFTTGKETIRDRVRLTTPPFLSTNQRGYLLTKNLKKGDKRKVPYFDPISLTGKDTIIEYKGIEKVYIHGRIYTLHRFTESFSEIRINTWLDNQGKVVKEESPAGFVFISEPEFKATNIVKKGKEILSSVSVPLQGDMPDPTDLTKLRFRLALPEEAKFSLNRDRQTYEDNILTVYLEKIPNDNSVVCSNKQEELASTPYVQAYTKPIADLNLTLLKEKTSPKAKVLIIADWVYENLEKRPVLGIPDALTTLHNRRGDCNEHASLFAALARNAGIPTRIAAGVTFHQGAFFYHAWNEVCLNDSWISLDTTKNQMPADITHIKFVEGEPDEMLKIGALLGKLQIKVLDNDTE